MKLITDGRQVLSETATVYGYSNYIGIHALASVVNSLAAAGADRIGVEVRIDYPPQSDKSSIYTIEKMIKKECARRKIEFLESRICGQPLHSVPFVRVNGIAVMDEERAQRGAKSFAGADIVLSKWIGMDGMLQAVREKAEVLKERFTPAFIRQIISYEEELFAGREIGVAKDMGVSFVRQITQGGIFAALWELSKELGIGLETDMRLFSVLQETVEVCEYFRMNPYQLTSAGSFLFVTEDGEALQEALLSENIMGAVIGRTTDGQGKIIKNGEDIRFIDRPAPDEIWKLHILEG